MTMRMDVPFPPFVLDSFYVCDMTGYCTSHRGTYQNAYYYSKT